MKSRNEQIDELALNSAIDADYKDAKRRWGLSAFIRGWNDHKYANFHCPYPDRRTDDNKITFSRGYRRRWKAGHEARRKWNIRQSIEVYRQSIEFESRYLVGNDMMDWNSAIMRASTLGHRTDFSHPREDQVKAARTAIQAKIESIHADIARAEDALKITLTDPL